MNKITDITRRDIIDIINNGFIEQLDGPVYDNEKGAFVTERAIFMPFYGRLDEIGFFSRLYDLTTLPSYDHRYHDALGDIKCHLGWGDYEKGWFFHDRRFKLLPENGDEPLLNFICEMLHPAVRATNSPWKLYLEKFNELLRADGYEIYAAQHISGRDVFKARPYTPLETQLLPDNLFTERYKELIIIGEGVAAITYLTIVSAFLLLKFQIAEAKNFSIATRKSAPSPCATGVQRIRLLTFSSRFKSKYRASKKPYDHWILGVLRKERSGLRKPGFWCRWRDSNSQAFADGF